MLSKRQNKQKNLQLEIKKLIEKRNQLLAEIEALKDKMRRAIKAQQPRRPRRGPPVEKVLSICG